MKIGILVTFVLAFLAVLTIKTGDFNFSKKGYMVKIQFDDIDGVSNNAPVMLNGLEVGSVKEIHIKNQDSGTVMELLVWLREDAQLKEDSKAYIKNMGFMGEKYIGLTSGKTGAVLPPGAVIVGREPADFDKLLADGQEIAKEIKEITQNVNTRLKTNEQAIDEIFKNLNASMAHLRSITANIDERLVVNKTKIDDIVENMRDTSVNLDQFTYDLKQNPWKLMYRPKGKRDANVKAGDTRADKPQ